MECALDYTRRVYCVPGFSTYTSTHTSIHLLQPLLLSTHAHTHTHTRLHQPLSFSPPSTPPPPPQGLRVTGWVGWAARGLGRAMAAGGVGGAVWLAGAVSVVLANLINNQPQTVLLTVVLLDPQFVEQLQQQGVGVGGMQEGRGLMGAAPYGPFSPAPLIGGNTTSSLFGGLNATALATTALRHLTDAATPSGGVGSTPGDLTQTGLHQSVGGEAVRDIGGGTVQLAALLGVVVGSNTGALFTLLGALAGLMWANILARFKLHLSYLDFFKAMAPLGVTTTVATLAVLWAQAAWLGWGV